MQERTPTKELGWWLSALLTLLAVLLPVAALTGIYRAATDPAQVDRLNEALGWTILQPVQVVAGLGAFFLSGALSCRLLVPTFLGVNPRLVSAIFCTAPVAAGAYITTLDPLSAAGYGIAALAWSQIVPLPLDDVLRYGPLRGGLLIGLGLAALRPVDGALIAILWCCWRLYRDHPLEVAVTAAAVAVLPVLLILDDPGTALGSTAGVYSVAETGLLICLSLGGLVLSRLIPPRPSGPEPAGDAASR